MPHACQKRPSAESCDAIMLTVQRCVHRLISRVAARVSSGYEIEGLLRLFIYATVWVQTLFSVSMHAWLPVWQSQPCPPAVPVHQGTCTNPSRANLQHTCSPAFLDSITSSLHRPATALDKPLLLQVLLHHTFGATSQHILTLVQPRPQRPACYAAR